MKKKYLKYSSFINIAIFSYKFDSPFSKVLENLYINGSRQFFPISGVCKIPL